MKSNIILFKHKKLLKKRSCLDGSIYNLESTLHSMDMTINRMVFDEMKKCDKV